MGFKALLAAAFCLGMVNSTNTFAETMAKKADSSGPKTILSCHYSVNPSDPVGNGDVQLTRTASGALQLSLVAGGQRIKEAVVKQALSDSTRLSQYIDQWQKHYNTAFAGLDVKNLSRMDGYVAPDDGPGGILALVRFVGKDGVTVERTVFMYPYGAYICK